MLAEIINWSPCSIAPAFSSTGFQDRFLRARCHCGSDICREDREPLPQLKIRNARGVSKCWLRVSGVAVKAGDSLLDVLILDGVGLTRTPQVLGGKDQVTLVDALRHRRHP